MLLRFARFFSMPPLGLTQFPRCAGSFAVLFLITVLGLAFLAAAPVMAETQKITNATQAAPASTSAGASAASPSTESNTAANPALAPTAEVSTSGAAPGTTNSSTSPVSWTNSPSLLPPPGGLTLTPFLTYLPESSGIISAEKALAATLNPTTGEGFRKRSPSENLLLRAPHGVWVHFSMVQVPGFSRTGANFDTANMALLDLGDQIPGAANVWVRPTNAALREVKPDENNLYALADMAQGGDVFIHMQGQPGLWFAPALRSLPEALSAPERRLHQLALAGLAMLFLLCLTRSVTERGDGRIWAAIFAGAALLHAMLDLPATVVSTSLSHIRYLDMPGILAAGVALMLLPHVGRNIMRTREVSPGMDTVLLALAIPGAALGLLPFLPNMAWAIRLLPLWPMGAILSLVPALILLRRGVPGSAIFSLACLSMTVGTALALWSASATPDAHTALWAQGPLIGVIAAVLLLAAAPRSAYGDKAEAISDANDTQDDPLELDLETESNVVGTTISAMRIEENMRAPLDALLREACALDQVLGNQTIVMPSAPHMAGGAPQHPFGLAPTARSRPINEQDARMARRHADNLVAASRELSALVTNIPRTAALVGRPVPSRRVFSLDKLVAEAIASVREEADAKNIGLSWYIAPYLGRKFRADYDRLRFTLRMLLTDAVRATTRGVVSLRIRRGPHSLNPGHLMFSVSDTGEGLPPMARSSLMLARTWELAADHDGELNVNSNPYGVEICFSLDCDALVTLDQNTTNAPCPPTMPRLPAAPGTANTHLVILASSLPLNRHLLSWHLANQGQEIWEARDAAEAVAFYMHTPAALLILDGNLPEDDVVTAIASIRVFEGEHLLAHVPFLALARDEDQAQRLRQAGCDDALLLPVSRDALRAVALQLANGSVHPRPDFSPHRVTIARPKKDTPSATTAPTDSSVVASPMTPERREAELMSMPASAAVAMPASVEPVEPVDLKALEVEPVDTIEVEANMVLPPPPPLTLIPVEVATDLAEPLAEPAGSEPEIPLPDTMATLTVVPAEPASSVPGHQQEDALQANQAKPKLSLRMVGLPEPKPAPQGMTLSLPVDKKPGMTLIITPFAPASTVVATPSVSEQKPLPAPDETPHPAPMENLQREVPPAVAAHVSTLILPVNPPAEVFSESPVEPADEPAVEPAASVVENTHVVAKDSAENLPGDSTNDTAPKQLEVKPEQFNPVPTVTQKHVPEPYHSGGVNRTNFEQETKQIPERTAEATKSNPVGKLATVTGEALPNSVKPQTIKNVVPPKKRSWLALFKPTPHIDEPSVDTAPRSGSEWVGNPVPVGGVSAKPAATTATSRAHPPMQSPLAPSGVAPSVHAGVPSFLPDLPDHQDEPTQFLVVNSVCDFQGLGIEPLQEVQNEGPQPSFIPAFSPIPHTAETVTTPKAWPTAKSESPKLAEDNTIINAQEHPATVRDETQFTPLLPIEPAQNDLTAESSTPLARDFAGPEAFEVLRDQLTSPIHVPEPQEQALLFDAHPLNPELLNALESSSEQQPPNNPGNMEVREGVSAPDKATRQRRRKNRMQDLPFLSLDPNYIEVMNGHADAAQTNGADTGVRQDEIDTDNIMDLTEADMLDTALVQQIPEMLTRLDTALERVEQAMHVHDARGMAQSAASIEEQARALGLHGLSDLAQFLIEAATQRDFETATQLLPDLRTEIARQRNE